MKKIILILFLNPILCDGQLKISVDIIERTDTKKEFKQNINISLSKHIYKNIETGITNRKSLADYISEGQTPIQDSITISNYQIFAKYHFENNLFFTLISPITNYNSEIKLVDRIRIGGGYIFKIEKDIFKLSNFGPKFLT